MIDWHILHHRNKFYPKIGIMNNLIRVLDHMPSFLGRNLEVDAQASVFSIIIRSVSIDWPKSMMNLILKSLRVASINHLRRMKIGMPQGKSEFPAT